MNEKQRTKISKNMSLLLRHRPELGNLTLDEQGWVDINDLIAGLARRGIKTSPNQVMEVIAINDKQRFAWDEEKNRVRANQGHSVNVELDLPVQEPPPLLYHGTVERFLPSIRKQGLTKRTRHHVHLSGDPQTAKKVGQRRGNPILLKVNAQQMHDEGHTFYRSENGVWLTESVPPSFLTFPSA